MAGKVRWGILSTARINDQLVRAIRLSYNGELVAVASRDKERASAWAREHGVPLALGSYEELLALDQIDAVYNPLPNALHKEWSLRAAEQGKNVLCEKPLALNAHEAQTMADAAARHGVLLMEAFMYRFHPQYEIVRRLIGEGRVGEPRILRGAFGFFLDRPKDIRWERALGGGALLDVGCYPVNAARMLIGAEPVAAQASAVWTISDVDESIAGLLEFPNGVLVVIDASFRTGFYQTLVISGTRGQIRVAEPFVNGEHPTELDVVTGDQREVIQAPGANKYQKMVEHFGEAVLSGQALAYPAERSVRQMRVLDALERAARTGTRVEIK